MNRRMQQSLQDHIGLSQFDLIFRGNSEIQALLLAFAERGNTLETPQLARSRRSRQSLQLRRRLETWQVDPAPHRRSTTRRRGYATGEISQSSSLLCRP